MLKIKILLLVISGFLFGASNDAYTHVQICKAALSSIMGVDIAAIETQKGKDGIVYLHYRIEGENDRFDYKCRLEGSKVIWGSANGRWRTKKSDAMITFQVRDGSVTIKERYNDELRSQGTKTTFPLSKL
ncbi:hypothetical protein PGH07_07265 [Sulfurovum sp. zt1-1]|uniref:Uncharacterized protein n=1 Tax=Sulfurovum zhangzhouensis TaxID=3019067 RepID=A0ABT7QYR6_9BACT|nr:hypothetical protein [Sulfurovum zhangzhouensis]MDM5271973.1 hypothetical protein [Sulfurovum zhangzhouensis]